MVLDLTNFELGSKDVAHPPLGYGESSIWGILYLGA